MSMPIGMAIKKYYCHKCGDRLCKHANTRTVYRGDPDYDEWRRYNGKKFLGDIDGITYNFRCYTCKTDIEYDEQHVISKIQKLTGSTTLTEADIAQHRPAVEQKMEKGAKIYTVIFRIVTFIILAIWLYFWIKSGADIKFRL